MMCFGFISAIGHPIKQKIHVGRPLICREAQGLKIIYGEEKGASAKCTFVTQKYLIQPFLMEIKHWMVHFVWIYECFLLFLQIWDSVSTQAFILLHVDYLLLLDMNPCLAVSDTYSLEHQPK